MFLHANSGFLSRMQKTVVLNFSQECDSSRSRYQRRVVSTNPETLILIL